MVVSSLFFMERPPLISSIFIVLGFFWSICVVLVESDELNLVSPSQPILSPPPPPPPPPSVSMSPPPPSPSPSRHHPPPPPRKFTNGSNKKSNNTEKSPHWQRNHRHPNKKAHDRKMNLGKKIGLLFAGFAGILQVAVIGFLVYKRLEISKIKDRHENCS